MNVVSCRVAKGIQGHGLNAFLEQTTFREKVRQLIFKLEEMNSIINSHGSDNLAQTSILNSSFNILSAQEIDRTSVPRISFARRLSACRPYYRQYYSPFKKLLDPKTYSLFWNL